MCRYALFCRLSHIYWYIPVYGCIPVYTGIYQYILVYYNSTAVYVWLCILVYACLYQCIRICIYLCAYTCLYWCISIYLVHPDVYLCVFTISSNHTLSVFLINYSTIICKCVSCIPVHAKGNKETWSLIMSLLIFLYVTGPANIDHVSANYTKLYFY